MPDPIIIMNHFSILASIIQTVAILMGIGMVISGFFLLKKFGESRTMMSHHMTIVGPLMMLLAGVLLLSLPTTLCTFLYAIWGTYTPLTYVGSGGGFDDYVPVVLMFVRLIGVTAVIRGVVMMSRVGGQHSQPGAIGRGLMFIFCGILAVHILGTYHLLLQILDYT